MASSAVASTVPDQAPDSSTFVGTDFSPFAPFSVANFSPLGTT